VQVQPQKCSEGSQKTPEIAGTWALEGNQMQKIFQGKKVE